MGDKWVIIPRSQLSSAMIFQVSPNWHRSCHVEGWKLSLHNKNGKSQGLCEFRGGNAKSENYGNFTCNLERIWSIIDHQWWYTINMNGKSMLRPKKYSMDNSPAKMIFISQSWQSVICHQAKTRFQFHFYNMIMRSWPNTLSRMMVGS